ncbi:MAG: HetZ-related protein 2 [Spirulinaceae cyanobacterium]
MQMKPALEEPYPMTKLASQLEETWRDRLQEDYPQQNPQRLQSIVRWLLGEDLKRFEGLAPNQTRIVRQAMDYRYRILQQRYFGVAPTQAYRNLITRLGSLVMLRNKIRTWVALSRDRQRAVADVIQEVIQEMLNSDRYVQKQIAWIAECTTEERLRDTLLLTTIEEYCLRPIRNQPLLVYRFVNFLRRSQKGGMTQVPQGDIIRLISEELTLEASDSPVSLLDSQAITDWQDTQDWEEQQVQRSNIKREFEKYLEDNISSTAALWLQLYLQGRSQDAIAKILELPIKQVYRLREKVSYHAIKVFALKGKPELVANWLEISLKEHNLGLTPKQWEEFVQNLNPIQHKLIEALQDEQSFEAIAQSLNWKLYQVMGEWSKIYLAAQSLRSEYSHQLKK